MVISGEVAEWLKAQHWKCCIGVTLSRVRIPLSPFYISLFWLTTSTPLPVKNFLKTSKDKFVELINQNQLI